jgi:hypothetical protein
MAKTRKPKYITKAEYQATLDRFLQQMREDRANEPDVYYARDDRIRRYDIQGMVAYLIRCPRCIDTVLWMYGCSWKTVCHCTLIWDMAFDGNDKPVAIGRNPKKWKSL